MNKFIDYITKFVFLNHSPEKSDFIMVVGGSFPEAPELASVLWKNNYSDKIFISGKFSRKKNKFEGPRSKSEIYNKIYETEYDFYKDVLKINGVNEKFIFGEDKSTFTRENAEFSKDKFDSMGIDIGRMILICKSFHARRCYSLYKSSFPNTEILVVPFDAYNITSKNWYLSKYGIKRVFGEILRIFTQVLCRNILKIIRK